MKKMKVKVAQHHIDEFISYTKGSYLRLLTLRQLLVEMIQKGGYEDKIPNVRWEIEQVEEDLHFHFILSIPPPFPVEDKQEVMLAITNIYAGVKLF